MNSLSWIPQGMPILCLPLWWVIKLVFLVLGFVFHPLSFLRKEHVLSQFKARKRKELGICSLDLSSSVVKSTGRKYWTLGVNLTPILSVSFSLTQAQFAIISALRTGPELRYSRLRFDGYYRIRKGVNNSQTFYFLEVMAADFPFAVFTCFLKRDQIEEIRILNLESQLKLVENDGDELKETGDLFMGEE